MKFFKSKTTKIFMLLAVVSSFLFAFNACEKDEPKEETLKNQVEINGTKYEMTEAVYYAMKTHTEFMLGEKGMFDMSNGLITGKQINIADIKDEEYFVANLQFEEEGLYLTPGEMLKTNGSGWIKAVKNGEKYTVSFDLKTDKQTVKGMFEATNARTED